VKKHAVSWRVAARPPVPPVNKLPTHTTTYIKPCLHWNPGGFFFGSAATIDPTKYRKCCLMPGLCGKGGGGAAGEHVCSDHAETGDFAAVPPDAIDFAPGRRQAVFNRRQEQRAFMSAGDFDLNAESSAGMNQKGLYKAYGDLSTTKTNKIDPSKPRGALDSNDGRTTHTAAVANYAPARNAVRFGGLIARSTPRIDSPR